MGKNRINLIKLILGVRRWPAEIHKLRRYKKKKLKQEKSKEDRPYLISFTLKIEDPYNEKEIGDFQMLVPAQAAYYAKKKVDASIRHKIKVDCTDVTALTEDQLKAFNDSKIEFVASKIKETW